MNLNTDIVTKLANQILNVLLLNAPYDTSIGFLIGIVCDGFLQPLLEPAVMNLLGADLSAVKLVHWIALSILIMNGKNIFRKRRISPEAESAFALISEARKLGLSDLEMKQKYRYIVEKYASNIALNREARQELERMRSLRSSSKKHRGQEE